MLESVVLRNYYFLLALFILVVPCFAEVLTVDSTGEGDFVDLEDAIMLADRHDAIEVSCYDWDPNCIADIDFYGKDIIIKSNCPNDKTYFDKSGFHSGQKTTPIKRNYVQGEIIVKYKQAVNINSSSLSLKRLNTKYKLKSQRKLFKDFEQHQQYYKTLAAKDTRQLTKKEQHIAKRAQRTPKGVTAPDLDRIYLLKFNDTDDDSLQQLLDEYRADSNVEFVELNYIIEIDQAPNDPLYWAQWGLENTGQDYPTSGRYNLPPGTTDMDVDAPQAWDVDTGSSDIIVAVVDTGVDYTHRDLSANIWGNDAELNGIADIDDDENGYIDDIYGYDFYNDDNNPKDDHGHGTHCAGIIAADSNNSTDVAGISWQSSIMSLKFLSSSGRGSVTDAVDAIYYAVNNGADVISNSWGSSSSNSTLTAAIDYAYSQGVVFVAAAGNEGNTDQRYPAACDHVISVAATDSNDDMASFSTYGSWVDIAAPGVDILSLRAYGTYMGTVYDDYTTTASGTSMACPFVSGACAVLLSMDNDLSVDEIETALKSGVDAIDSSVCQSGRLNLNAAISAMVSSEGVIRLDNTSYGCSDQMTVEVRDADIQGVGTISISVSSDGGDSETITLSEVATNFGIFKGTLSISSDTVLAGDGTLQVADGQVITASYDDADNGSGSPAVVTETAVVDCQGPVLTNVEVVNITHKSVDILVEADEPVSVKLKVGETCGTPYSIIADGFGVKVVHTIPITQLSNNTDYYFVVEATDIAGNVTTDDNSGVCYTFTTPEFFGFRVPSVYPTIQDAIDAAETGDEIIVEDGVFSGEGNYEINYNGKNIVVRSENGPENCIIDCNGLGRAFHLNNYETRAAIIKGFTIISGESAVISIGTTASPTIESCVIRDCDAEGGGVITGAAYPLIVNCQIYNNIGNGINATGSGAVTVTNCIIQFNDGVGIYAKNGNLSTSTITGCTISDNMDDGIFTYDGFTVIDDCTICDNKGSGIYVYYENELIITNSSVKRNKESGINVRSATLIAESCIVSDNFSTDSGGGIRCLWDEGTSIKNCVIANNYSTQNGGGIYIIPIFSTFEEFINCTVTNNTADIYGGGVGLVSSDPVQVTNCIIWGNTAPSGSQIYNNADDADISFSNVQGGLLDVYAPLRNLHWGYGMTDEDPQFSFSDDYHLLAGSPCIDAGTSVSIQTDIHGRDRSMDGDNDGTSKPDMGAYEFEYNSDTPIIALETESFEFYNFNGQPNPNPQYLSIMNCLGGSLNWEVSDDSFWLNTEPSSGTSTGEIDQVEITVDTTTLSHGNYSGTLTITGPNAINSPKEVTVTLHIADEIRVPKSYPTIQEAIDAVGDLSTITVSDGTYTGQGNRDITFRGKAITLKSENGPENCIIDCNNLGRGFVFDSLEQSDTVLDGFTIINGETTGLGGGIYMKDSGPAITHCIVRNCCSSSSYGGGIMCHSGTSHITNCIVKDNEADGDGGGIYCYKGPAQIDNTYILRNTANERGGGIYIAGDSTLSNSIVAFNIAGTVGGGLSMSSGSPVVGNCTFYGNSSNNYGGDLYLQIGYSRDCYIYNSVLWGSIPNAIYNNDATLYVDCCNIQGGEEEIILDTYGYLYWGSGNFDVKPEFIDPNGPDGVLGTDDDDFRLASDSPCIDAGNEEEVTSTTDLDGNQRVIYDGVDMGAYEFGQMGDIDRDVDVDQNDLTGFVQDWLEDRKLYFSLETSWWKMDGSGLDSTGNGYDGVLSGTGGVWSNDGKFNGAVDLNGGNAYIQVPFVIDPSEGAFSIFMWVKGDSTSQCLISQADTGIGDEIGRVWLKTNGDSFLVTALKEPGSSNLVSGYSGHTDDTWHHLGLVFDGSVRALYVDGQAIKGDTESLSGLEPCTGIMYFGTNKSADGAFFNGLIDDARIYDFALTSEQIDNVYEGLSITEVVSVCDELSEADFDRDCDVDLNDFSIFCENWLINVEL